MRTFRFAWRNSFRFRCFCASRRAKRNEGEGFIAEDLQWFDPTSIDLGHALSDR
jgi:hypothetical protein